MSDKDTIWITLDKGLSIYQRPSKSKNWYLYIDKPEQGIKRVRKSLKTSDQQEATKLAWRRLILAEDASSFSEVFSTKPSFKTLAEETLAQVLSAKVERGEASKPKYKYAIERQIEYFGNKPIDAFTQSDIEGYYSKMGFQSKTPWRYATTALSRIFERAVGDRHIQAAQVPNLPKKWLGEQKSRDFFMPEEVDFICAKLHEWTLKATRKDHLENRILFSHFCQFILTSGFRPGTEIYSVKYSDIHFLDETYGRYEEGYEYGPGENGNLLNKHEDSVAAIRLKKGKTTRDVDYFILSETNCEVIAKMIMSLGMLQDMGMESKSILHEANNYIYQEQGFYYCPKWIKEEKEKGSHLFARRNGTKPDFGQMWGDFKEEIKVIFDDNSKISLYSFRHTYITNQLLEGKPIAAVAKRTRTSEMTISKYYNKLDNLMTLGYFKND